MYNIKQSTAQTLLFFAHDENGDAVTGLTDGSFTKRISKTGTFAAMTVTISEQENGWYSFTLSTSHSDTLGIMTIVFTNGGAKQVNLQFRVEAKLVDDLNDIAATAIVSGGAIDTTGGAVDLVTANTDMRGTDSAATATAMATIDSNVDAVKAKTDSLTFTVANQVDSNAKSMNDTAITGAGTEGDPWT